MESGHEFERERPLRLLFRLFPGLMAFCLGDITIDFCFNPFLGTVLALNCFCAEWARFYG